MNHTMARILAMVCNERQTSDRDVHLPHVEYVYNNSVSAATARIGRLPCLHLATFDRFYGGAHQSLDRDHPAYCDFA